MFTSNTKQKLMLLCSKINRCDNIGIFPNESIQTGAPLWNDMSKEIHNIFIKCHKTDYQSLLGMGGNRSNKSGNSHGRWKVLYLPSNLTRNKLVDSILLIEIVQFIFIFTLISMITQQGWKCHRSIHFTYNMKSNASEGTIKFKGICDGNNTHDTSYMHILEYIKNNGASNIFKD